MKYKYVVIAGRVKSKSDGEEHWITSHRLCELYGVDSKECYLIDRIEYEHIPHDLVDLPVLIPKYNGDYSLPNSI